MNVSLTRRSLFENSDPGALAREHRRIGYRAAYVPKIELNDRDR